MTKKFQSTCEEHLASMSPARRKKFDEGYRNFALSELVLALLNQDEESINQLARIAGVSSCDIDTLRFGSKDEFALTSVVKALEGLGFTIRIERGGETTELDSSQVPTGVPR